MDDVAIWNRALTPAEIVQLAAGTLPPDVDLAATLGTDVRDVMYEVNSSAYLRMPFALDRDAAELDALGLNVTYDDGLIVYLNGQEVARRGVDGPAAWDTAASQDLEDPTTEQIDLSAHIDKLNNGDNVLAIQIVNANADNIDLLLTAELTAIDVEEVSPTDHRYFPTPTPGGPNGAGVLGLISEEVVFSRDGGAFTDDFDLTLSGNRSGAEIHYTTDGSIPTAESLLYTDSIAVSGTIEIRARLTAPDLAPGPINTEGFVHLTAEVEAFESPLPIVIIENFGAGAVPNKRAAGQPGGDGSGILQVPFQSATMAVFDRVDGTSTPANPVDLSTRVGIRIRGTSSANFAKKSYWVETWGDVDNDVNMSVLGMPSESDWILYAPTQDYDQPMIHNSFIYQLSNQTGNYAVRTQFVEVFVNIDGGSLSMNDYAGLYVFMERIKRDGDRVDFNELSPDGTEGGWMVTSDRMDPIPIGGDSAPQHFHTAGPDRILQTQPNQSGVGDDIPTSYNTFFNFYTPDGDLINPVQRQTIEDWFGEFEDALYGPDFADPDLGYAAYLDVDSLIDHFILNNLPKNRDGLQLSTWMVKESPEAKLTFGPIWDFDRAFTRSLINGGDPMADLDWGKQFLWMPRLFEDPNFEQAYVDRWQELRQGPLSTENMFAIIDAQAAEITEEVVARNGTPNWSGSLTDMKNWIRARVDALDAQFTPPPVMSSPGGIVSAGFELSLSAQNEIIQETVVLPDMAWVSYLVPTDNSLGTTWTDPNFDDLGWLYGNTGIGYEDEGADYFHLLWTEVRPRDVSPQSNSVFVRAPFDLFAGQEIDRLTLHMNYDDGFVAYLNGQEVARRNVSDAEPGYDATASQHPDNLAIMAEAIDITEHIGLLNIGANVLAIHVINTSPDSSDLLIMPQVVIGTEVENPSPPSIYYTTDGTDPRSSTGDISASAQYYFGMPLRIDENTTVTARAIDWVNNWSGPTEALFFVGVEPATAANLAITELNYNPHDPTPAELAINTDFNNDDFEYIELRNIGAAPIDLTGVEFTDGIAYGFTGGNVTVLAPGDYVLVVKDTAAFEVRYGSGLTVAGEFAEGSIRNSGEQIMVAGYLGETIHLFRYDDSGSWPGRADGKGASLEVLNVAGDYDLPTNWRSSGEYGGSPGFAGTGPRTDVVINEVLTHTDGQFPETQRTDTIELHNVSMSTVDIGGWYLSDDADDYLKFPIPAGTEIPPGGYVTFDEHDFNPNGPWNPTPTGEPTADDFALNSAHGDHVWLMEADAPGSLVGFVDHVKFGATANDVSLGRWPDASGILFPMEELTLGDENTGPLVSDVTINELHYHPAEPPIGSTITENELEFVELFNATNQSVDVSNWRLDDGVEFTFVAGTVIAARGTLVVVGFNPADETLAGEFRSIHGIGDSVPLLGPYSGRLENVGERVALAWPDESPMNEPTFVPYVLADEVTYDDGDPWPIDAAGVGQSLHRTEADAFGNFPASWEADAPSPGAEAVYRYPGDANLDGVTDVRDFMIWNVNKFTNGTDWTTGDFNGDTVTDVRDFMIWNVHKFTSAPAPAPILTQAVDDAFETDAISLSELVWLSELLDATSTRDDDGSKSDEATDKVLAFYW